MGLLRLKPSRIIPPSSCILNLTNGDQIRGTFFELLAGRIILSTPQTGQISVPFDATKNLIPVALPGKIVFEGVGDRKDWTFPNVQIDTNPIARLLGLQGKWAIRDKTLVSGGGNGASMGRTVTDMPDQVRLDCQVNAPTGKLQLGIHLFNDDLSNWREGKSVGVTIKNDSISPKQYPVDGASGNNGRMGKSAPFPLAETKDFKLTIRADRTKGAVSVEINDEMVGTWKQEGAFKSSGKGIMLVSRGNQPVNITNLKIAHDASPIRAPSAGKAPGSNLKNTDHVHLLNGDVLMGKLVSLMDDRIKIKTAFGNVKIPLNMTDSIHFAKSNAAKTPKPTLEQGRPVQPVQVVLSDQSQISGHLIQTADKELTVQSARLGLIKITTATIRDIDFQTAKKRIFGSDAPQGRPRNGKPQLVAPELPVIQIDP